MLIKKDNTVLLNNFFWSIIIFFFGMVMVINQSVGFDLSIMPGNLGDGRFNNYLLEHGYDFLIKGNVHYWDAPFFFPEKDVISYSDNLFGALPIYVILRFFVDRETSFQLWFLILIVLNFWGAYYAIRKLKVSVYASSVGAFIYAFSSIILLQSGHIQLLPRFVAPFAIVSFYLWLQGNNNKYFYISIFLLTYQFFCAIYLGYFLVYVLMVMFGIYLFKEWKADIIIKLFTIRKDLIRTLFFLFFIICLVFVLFYPYYLRSNDGAGYPPLFILKEHTPYLWSYFLAPQGSILWEWSNSYIINQLSLKQLHIRNTDLFIGALPYIFLVTSFFMYRKDYRVRFFLVTLFILFILTLQIFDFSIYPYIVHLIPGARAIRVLSRYMVIAVFLWSIVSAFFLDLFLAKSNTYIRLFIFIIPVLLIMDNINFSDKRASLKIDFQKRSMLVVQKYEKLKHINPSAKAFALQFNTDSIQNIKLKRKMFFVTNLDAMMASQIIGLPCVNGYSAREPFDYQFFYSGFNTNNMNSWLHSDFLRTQGKQQYQVKDILILE